jgi:diaminohydroxyphosphoribosylaminopyrimidine deaminase / 5-amino-6-(5-phosphoribosylamino)uracil reductase
MTVRLPGCDRKPLRVVLDARLDLPLRSRLVVGARDFPTLVFCGAQTDPARRAALEEQGVEVADCDLAAGRIDLRAALRQLGARGLTRIFSEGGPRVGAELIAQGLADEMILFTAPKPLGRKGVEALSARARDTLADAALYRVVEQGLLGADRFIHYERI